MSKTDLVKLRVVTAFNVYSVGAVIERMPSVAKHMLAARWYDRKLVELVELVEESKEPKAEEPKAKAEAVTAPTPEIQPELSHDSRANSEARQPDHPAVHRHGRNRQRDR